MGGRGTVSDELGSLLRRVKCPPRGRLHYDLKDVLEEVAASWGGVPRSEMSVSVCFVGFILASKNARTGARTRTCMEEKTDKNDISDISDLGRLDCSGQTAVRRRKPRDRQAAKRSQIHCVVRC